VAQADSAADDEDDIWKPTTFHVPPSRPAAREAVHESVRESMRESARESARDAAPVRVVHEVARPQVPPRLPQRTPQPAPAAPAFGASARVPARRLPSEVAPEVAAARPAVFRRRADGVEIANAVAAAPVTAAPVAAAPIATAPTPAAPLPVVDPKLMDELQAMRTQLQQQLASLSSTVAASRQEMQARIAQMQLAARGQVQTNAGRVMTRLLTAGFSPEVARKVALHAPASASLPELENWLQDVMTLNLKIAGPEASIVEAGGAYALVGPTGVGKTTTVAKLAAQFAVRYGAGALGLITLDAYRVGAHEQLRTYGRILGAPVHLAQDGATLRELMVSMQNKRLVLIDTCGVSQRDGRLNEVLSMLAAGAQGVPEAMQIRRLLLANAASHAETLDDAARAWRAPECAGCVLTKLDEAARIGGAIDTALRYKLRVFGVTNGQRVPEDWHAANARVLTHLALRPGSDAFALADNEALALVTEREPRHAAAAH
jgi:flagellar biosynthesis protein FlhF